MNDGGDSSLDLKARTSQFALRIVRLYCALPKSTEAQVLGKQVLRSGTSVGAQYHEATRSRSPAEFVSKIEGGLQELEETRYWLWPVGPQRYCVSRQTGGRAAGSGRAACYIDRVSQDGQAIEGETLNDELGRKHNR